jgi:hypothetical protein
MSRITASAEEEAKTLESRGSHIPGMTVLVRPWAVTGIARRYYWVVWRTWQEMKTAGRHDQVAALATGWARTRAAAEAAAGAATGPGAARGQPRYAREYYDKQLPVAGSAVASP